MRARPCILAAVTILSACVDEEPAEIVEPSAATLIATTTEPDYVHPWVVDLPGCQGTLIDAGWVLTAAHCVPRLGDGTVSYTRRDPVTGASISGRRQVRLSEPGRGVFVHPGYAAGSTLHDVALLRLDPPFELGPYLRPVSLPSGNGYRRIGTIAARRDDAGSTPGTDEVVRSRLSAASACGAPDGAWCVQDLVGGVCEGDGGAGFVTPDLCKPAVTAVVGERPACRAGAWTEVADVVAHRDWIVTTMGRTWPTTLPSECGNGSTLIQQGTSGAVVLRHVVQQFGAWSHAVATVGAEWTVQGTGDFDGDRQQDVLWRNQDTGQVSTWYLADGWIRDARTQAPGRGLAVQAIADFDGDRRADLLWRDGAGQLAIWFDGNPVRAAFPGYAGPNQPVDNAWRVVGARDVNGDQRADIVWRHQDGRVAIWHMVGATRVGEAYPGGADPARAWTLQALGDLDGDLRADLLWRDTSGTLRVWFGGDARAVGFPSYQNRGGGVPLDWTIAALADFDGDGHADLLWRNRDNLTVIWFMEGARFLREGTLGADPAAIRAVYTNPT